MYGLVLVTGPTGSGKTTTLATLIHQINSTRACHIVTIEDPLEYVHRNIKSLVQQRELYTDIRPMFHADSLSDEGVRPSAPVMTFDWKGGSPFMD